MAGCGADQGTLEERYQRVAEENMRLRELLHEKESTMELVRKALNEAAAMETKRKLARDREWSIRMQQNQAGWQGQAPTEQR